MKRNTINLVLDIALAINGLAVACTGLLMWLVLPAQSRQSTVWTMTRHDWGDLHLYLALGLIGLLAIHLTLHWSWVCAVAGNILTRAHISVTGKTKAVTGAAVILLVVAIVGGFLWAATVSLVKAEDGGGGGGRRQRWESRDQQPLHASAPTGSPQVTSIASSGIDISVGSPGPSLP